MNIIIAIILILVIFGCVFYAKYSQKKNDRENFGTEEVADFDQEFFKRVEAGEKSQLVVTFATQQDCALIRSLLHADGIPSYVEGEHMNNIYGGIAGSMVTVVGIKLYILCADYDKAVEIIKTSKLTDAQGYTIFDKQE